MSDEINRPRRIILSAAAMTLAAAQFGIVGSAAAEFAKAKLAPSELSIEGDFPSLRGAAEWLNSSPLTPDG
jgi:hypothetical protein